MASCACAAKSGQESAGWPPAGSLMSNHFFIFAGADVAAAGSDKLLTDSYRFSPLTQTYTKLPDMPVAVADSLALAYQERYLSGQRPTAVWRRQSGADV